MGNDLMVELENVIVGIIFIMGITILVGAFVICGYHEFCTEDVHHHYKIVDKRIEKGYGSDLIIVTTNGEYSVLSQEYMDADVNDTLDVITDQDGHYKRYKIIK